MAYSPEELKKRSGVKRRFSIKPEADRLERFIDGQLDKIDYRGGDVTLVYDQFISAELANETRQRYVGWAFTFKGKTINMSPVYHREFEEPCRLPKVVWIAPHLTFCSAGGVSW